MIKKKKVSIICGTRPQLIKLTALLPAITSEFQVSVINTAQHYSPELTKHFSISEHSEISYVNCKPPKGDPNQQIAKMLLSINHELVSTGLPDAVIVIGDTNSTLAGAIVASKLSLPLIHIEAGVRCFNSKLTEEQNRIITDSLSSLLLCPTKKCTENLRACKSSGKIVLSGDLLLDLFLSYSSVIPNVAALLNRIKCPATDYALLSLHRKENTSDNKKLDQILRAIGETDYKFIFLIHPRIKNLVSTVKIPSNVICSKSLSYSDTLTLQKHARLILTDSGGIAREAYFSGVPLGVLRDNFEWSEILKAECNKLLGTEEENIKAFIESPKKNYLGDLSEFGTGGAKYIISQEIKKFIN